eukprot:scaffold185558_cov35-Tisochrysis_lutea.AAC.1
MSSETSPRERARSELIRAATFDMSRWSTSGATDTILSTSAPGSSVESSVNFSHSRSGRYRSRPGVWSRIVARFSIGMAVCIAFSLWSNAGGLLHTLPNSALCLAIFLASWSVMPSPIQKWRISLIRSTGESWARASSRVACVTLAVGGEPDTTDGRLWIPRVSGPISKARPAPCPLDRARQPSLATITSKTRRRTFIRGEAPLLGRGRHDEMRRAASPAPRRERRSAGRGRWAGICNATDDGCHIPDGSTAGPSRSPRKGS